MGLKPLAATRLRTWPDETTCTRLTQHTIDVGLSAYRRTKCSVALGKMHSEFGRIVSTEDLEGCAPYLALTKLIFLNDIKREAEKASVPARKIGQTVRSLSESLG